MNEMKYLLVACFLLASACGGTPVMGDPDSGPRMDTGVPTDAFVPTDGSTPMPDTGPIGCIADAECDDGGDCTTDTCNTATGACRHAITPALCAPGESCNTMTGDCEMGRICGTTADCMDTDPCTTMETCDPASRVCTFQPLDGDADGDPPRVCGGGDCDDSLNYVFAGAIDRCGDDLDQDCDGMVDESAGRAIECAAESYCTCNRSDQCYRGASEASWRSGSEAERESLETTAAYYGCVNVDEIVIAIGECARSTDCLCLPSQVAMDLCACGAGATDCGGLCANLTTDAAHCGSCDRACTSYEEECISGTCMACGSDGEPCCDTSTLGDYCGPGASCMAGTCRACGGDGEPCCTTGTLCSSTSLACMAGTCRCPGGGSFCPSPGGGAWCTDTMTDEFNCGFCGNTCVRGMSCTAGSCT